MTPAGAVRRFKLGSPPVTLVSNLALGAEGNLWFAATAGGQPASQAWTIRRIAPTGVVTEFVTGLALGSSISSLAKGPDGNLWFTETQTTAAGFRSRIGRFNPALAKPALPVGVGVPRVSGSTVTTRISCPAVARAACNGTVTLLATAKGTVIGKSSFTIPKGRSGVALTVSLNAAGRGLLARQAASRFAPGVLATLAVSARDASGGSRLVTQDATIKPVRR